MKTTLKKIDCVMVRVDDRERAGEFYRRVFGLIPTWADAQSTGLRFPESDAEIVLHTIAEIPARVDVTYLVDDVVAAVPELEKAGCTVVERPFDVAIGKCAVIRDPFGIALSLIDMTKGARA
jgi:lactoylglutathione lyase